MKIILIGFLTLRYLRLLFIQKSHIGSKIFIRFNKVSLNEMAIPLNGKQNNMQKSYFSKFATEALELKQDYIDSVFQEVEKWEKEIKSLIPNSFLSEPMKKQYLDILKQRFQVFY